jgi:hypothetical protein
LLLSDGYVTLLEIFQTVEEVKLNAEWVQP